VGAINTLFKKLNFNHKKMTTFHVPEAQAFAQKSPAQITEKVNSVLSNMEANTEDGTPITLKGLWETLIFSQPLDSPPIGF
jgi:hypothetical protein